MKRISTFFKVIAVSVSLIWITPVKAQPPQYHNGILASGGNSIPLAYLATGVRGQLLYPLGVFGAPPTGMQITNIYWAPYSGSTGSSTYSQLHISMKQASITTLSATAYETGTTMVFTSTNYTISYVGGNWFKIALQTPFPYDPTKPLLVEVNQLQAPFTNFFCASSTLGTPAGAFRNYSTAYNTATPAAAGAFMNAFGFDLEPVSTSPNDVGVASIDTPAGGCEGLQNVVVTVKNFGINQVDTLTVDWTFNGQPQNTVNYYQLLDTFNGAGSNSGQVLLGSVTLTGGQADTIVAWTSNPNNQPDTVTDNDMKTKGYFSVITIDSFPYYQDFESGQGDWTIGGTNSTWAFGTPAKTNIVGTASGVNAFVTGGLSTGLYSANDNSQVTSPCYDFRGFEGTPWVALNVNWHSESSWDGTALQSSVDGGKTWQNVGKFGDPNNWFNDNSLDGRAGGSSEGWAGIGTLSSSGWKRAKHVLPLSMIGSLVRFRLAFGSDPSIQYEGFAFDNFTLVDFRKPNLGPDKISFCGKPTVTLDPKIPLNGGLAWSDGDSSSLTKTVNITGQYWVSHTDSMINETAYDTIEIVQSLAPKILFDKLIDTISVDGQIVLDPKTPFNINYTWTPGGYTFPYLLVKGSEYGAGVHTFNLHVIDSVLCEDTKNITVIILDYTGIEEQGKAEMSVYPNPVESSLVLDIRNVQADKVEIRLFDVNGKLVYSNAFGISESRKIELNLSGIEAGSYMLQMITDNQSKVLHIVKK